MSEIVVKRGDTARTLTDTLEIDGVAANLTGATVVLVLRAPGEAAVRRVATVTGAATGEVSYQFVSGDTDTVKDFYFEWEVTFSGGSVLTFPSDTHHRLRVVNDLG